MNTSASGNCVCVVGCGRWLRCDDQAGLLAAQAIERAAPPRTRVVLTEAPAADVVNVLDGIDLLLLIDAARSDLGHPPGTLWESRLIRGAETPEHEVAVAGGERGRLRHRGAGNAHTLSVDTALSLAAELGVMPPQTWIYAIVVEDCGYGESVSAPVRRAIEALAREIPEQITAWMANRERHHA